MAIFADIETYSYNPRLENNSQKTVSRANRFFVPGQIWHLTHRCHRRDFLLKFVRDRRRWRHWLFQARKRFGLCVLNYIVTSYHVHPNVA